MKHNLLVDIRRHWKSYLSLFFLFLEAVTFQMCYAYCITSV
jgi:hypothetical protein